MHCCIPGCTNSSKQNNGVKFYYFPRKSIHMPWLCEKRQVAVEISRDSSCLHIFKSFGFLAGVGNSSDIFIPLS